MARHYVLFDVNYLCWRALYSTGQLTHMGDATGVIYGVLRDIQSARDRFPNSRFVFAFDHGKGLREQLYPNYKSTRRTRRLEEEEAEKYESLQLQVRGLKLNYLGEAGFSNIIFQGGYEADDLIASICLNCLKKDDKATIYSEDKDLYQLLSEQVDIYKPRSGVTYSAKNFRNEYRIPPHRWAKVKAIAGCKSDDIDGVEGVGEGTALKYVRDELAPTHKKYLAIKAAKKMWIKNLVLVKLPFQGCKIPNLGPDSCTPDKWEALMDKFGITTLGGGLPGGIDKPKPLLKV